jgi:hypothetical protein
MSVDWTVPAAATLEADRCSDCGVKAIWAGERRELRLCPHCFTLLWHFDWVAAARGARERAARERAEFEAQLAAQREQLKRERRERRKHDGEEQGREGDGGVQARDVALGVEARPESDEPQAGGGDSVERAAPGAGEAPAAQGLKRFQP